MPTLNWIGKNEIINHHNEVEYNILECKENIGEEASGNLLIKGDNLLALKSILPYYAGQVKMVYIDPPYNTGNTSWVYNDATDSPIMRKWLNKVVDKEDLSRSDKWLCMMYPRLKLLKKFLQEDGLIYISIDDAELFNLKMIMDEIFGAKNYFATLTWRGMHTVRNSSKDFNRNTEYVLVYAKKLSTLIKPGQKDTYFRFLVDKTANYPYDDNDGNGKYKLDPLYARNYAEPYVYEFENGVKWEAPAGTYPRYSKKSLKEMYEKNEIVFSGSTPKAKRFLKNVQEGVPPDTLLPTEMVKFNKDGTEHMIKVFGVKVFDQPKPTTLIKYLMNLQRKVDTDKNYIVMDSFAGSGTTGQAVMEQNEEDGGNRKFILIQIDEQLESNKQEHQTACDFLDKINKDYYIVELTKERLKRVIQGYSFSGKEKTELFSKKFTSAQILNLSTMEKVINEVNDIFTHEECNFNEIKKTFKENTLKVIGEREIEEFREGLGGGFQYCELSEPLFDEFGLLNENITHTMLAKHLYFTEFGQALKVENDLKNFIGTVKEVSLFLYSDQDFKKKNLMSILDKFEEKAIVYADRTTISKDELEKHNIVFKQLPFSIKDK